VRKFESRTAISEAITGNIPKRIARARSANSVGGDTYIGCIFDHGATMEKVGERYGTATIRPAPM
jgi:hypothetical protein